MPVLQPGDDTEAPMTRSIHPSFVHYSEWQDETICGLSLFFGRNGKALAQPRPWTDFRKSVTCPECKLLLEGAKVCP
jgi:hypothetical protein